MNLPSTKIPNSFIIIIFAFQGPISTPHATEAALEIRSVRWRKCKDILSHITITQSELRQLQTCKEVLQVYTFLTSVRMSFTGVTQLMKFTIYTLADPREPNIVRYVGCTYRLSKRIQQHSMVTNGDSAREAWVRELRKLKLAPTCRVVSTFDASAAEARRKERQCIDQHKSELLLNDKTAEQAGFTPLPKSTSLADAVTKAEIQAIETALQYFGGNKLKAAKQLKISRPTLYAKLRLYEMHDYC